jgi:hypothetical protein
VHPSYRVPEPVRNYVSVTAFIIVNSLWCVWLHSYGRVCFLSIVSDSIVLLSDSLIVWWYYCLVAVLPDELDSTTPGSNVRQFVLTSIGDVCRCFCGQPQYLYVLCVLFVCFFVFEWIMATDWGLSGGYLIIIPIWIFNVGWWIIQAYSLVFSEYYLFIKCIRLSQFTKWRRA